MSLAQLKFLAVFVSVALSDACWTRYMQSVAKRDALQASTWSATLIAVGSISIISYVDNPMYLIPACLGAFIGTYISILTTPEELK